MSNRKDRRNNDARVLSKREQFAANGSGSITGVVPAAVANPVGSTAGGGGGYGMGDARIIPASGQSPAVNPFIIPKSTGLNIASQTFPSNYYVEWNLSTWRMACDQATKMGWPVSIATLYVWAYQCSPFIQSLFNKIGWALDNIPFFITDSKGNQIEELTQELCNRPWQFEKRKEIAFSKFWGFTGLNIDPLQGKLYKYPMQQLDPINIMLRHSTFNFDDGLRFADYANLLYIQPSQSEERFLGFMQPITRKFIQENLNNDNWVAAGRRLAFPLPAFGYPQADGATDDAGNPINPLKTQAETIAATFDAQNALVYPYTLDEKGNVVKSIQIDFEKPGSSNGMWKVYSEFNEQSQREIMQMIFGGELTSTTGKNGNRSLGEVQERQFDAAINSFASFVLAVLNEQVRDKFNVLYKGLPKDWRWDFDRSKKWTLEEVERLSNVLVQSGKRLTGKFFEEYGLSPDFVEDAPAPGKITQVDESFAAYPVKKKF